MKPETVQTPGVFIPDSIWYSEELKPIDVRILGELRRLKTSQEGVIEVRARRIALKANCDEKTVAKRIRLLAVKGWIHIVEDTKRGGDAFKIRFVRAAVIAFLILSPSALHKLCQENNSVRDFTELYIISHRRRQRHTSTTKKTALSPQEDETLQRRISAQGQRAIWNPPTSIAARSKS